MTLQNGAGVSEERAPSLVGRTLCGKWRVVEVLGSGGMSTVYKGVHRNGKVVALKVLAPELARRAQVRRRFHREALLANQVRHPAAVSVLDDDVAEDGSVFLVMDYVDGQTLHDLLRLRGAPLNVDLVLDIADQVLDVLAAAHRQGIVHRDVKPRNIVRTAAGELRLLDFGIAQLRDGVLGGDETGEVVLGTPAFMAPEQARGETSAIDHRTDLWAVGATMFTLLSGHRVHHGASPTDVVRACSLAPAPSLRDFAPDTPDAVVACVDRALQHEKSRRWQSAEEMQREIRELRRGVGRPRQRQPASSGRRPRLSWIGLGLVAAALVVLAVQLGSRGSRPAPPDLPACRAAWSRAEIAGASVSTTPPPRALAPAWAGDIPTAAPRDAHHRPDSHRAAVSQRRVRRNATATHREQIAPREESAPAQDETSRGPASAPAQPDLLDRRE